MEIWHSRMTDVATNVDGTLQEFEKPGRIVAETRGAQIRRAFFDDRFLRQGRMASCAAQLANQLLRWGGIGCVASWRGRQQYGRANQEDLPKHLALKLTQTG
jgi:hypothetical protein